MDSTYFVLTFLVLVFAIVSLLKDRANIRLAGDILYEDKNRNETINIVKWVLFGVAFIYILYAIYNMIIDKDIMTNIDIGVFFAIYFIFFANYYTKAFIIGEEGVIKYNNFIRFKHIIGYEFKDTKNEKYKLIIRYKRDSELKSRRLIVDIYDKKEIEKIFKNKVIRKI
ncbi:MAG: hypothetical protein ACTHVE_09350 [Senegalia sp. (in: firmicutes)]|uniref:hypothetical protein n=1 Tax=Senegalia sp. (in: firmicutes) TaxID=1924098 RepID=UPI003F9E36D1